MKTFTQLVGTTATNSPQTYGGSYTTLANNNSAQNVAVGQSLVNDFHRYLLQKYFDNEKTVTLTTIGGQSLTLTATTSIGDKSATLTAAWTLPSCKQYMTFSDGEQRMTTFTNGSTAVSWADGLTGASTTAVKTVGVQDYSIPANISKIKDDTINIGQLKYHPKPVMSIQDWNSINFLPYNSDIPNYFFIYNGKFSVFPIPATTGNIITFNYKTRVIDMTFADYTTGNLTGATAGSTAITGTNTAWSATGKYPTGVDISFYNLFLRIDPPNGDGMWYPILQFNSDTSLTLALPIVSAPNITGTTTYTIGQMPYLSEDFHDMLVYGALKVYYNSIVDNPGKFKQYSELYGERLELLKEYASTKTVNLDLEDEPTIINPNLFIYKS